MATTKTPVSGVVSDFDPGATRPYAFVPPRPEEALRDAPILHHGANAGQTELLSGELLCDLTALTPLLVGNDQYLVGSAKPGTLDCAWTLDLEKNIIEPLRLEDGRVAIAPESLKGMIRHNLGALLGAPMERVAEHYFSFRPNLDHPQDKKNPRTLPAVVVDPQKREVLVLPDLKDFALVVDDGQVGAKLAFGSTVPKDARYIFDEGGVCMKVARYGKGRRSFDGWIKCRYRHGVDGEGRLASLFAGRAPTKARYGCALVDNAALMDGDARRASTPIPEAVWNHYLATRVELTDSPGLLTDTHILLKKKAGEPRATHDALKRSERLEKHQLIFVEIDDRGDIVSFGHDFRYRWAYFDSVRARFRAYEKHGKTMSFSREPRRELHPHGDELQCSTTGAPVALTGARLLAGYVADEQGFPFDPENDAFKPFRRLAGRFAPNMALEAIDPACAQEDDRFIDRGKGLFLRPLGSPKPSAYEFYLDQSGASTTARGLLTYGDVTRVDPGGASVQTINRSPRLAGRKFYLHQKDAANDHGQACYDQRRWLIEQAPLAAGAYARWSKTVANARKQGVELDTHQVDALFAAIGSSNEDSLKQAVTTGQASNERDGPVGRLKKSLNKNKRARDLLGKPALNDLEKLHVFEQQLQCLYSEQAAIARFVSAPGTHFRFSVRFRDLRPWELAALIAALAPEVLARALVSDAARFPKAARQARATLEAGSPSYALKLGHGRPLGLGSVQIEVRARIEATGGGCANASAADQGAWLAALTGRLAESGLDATVARWLAALDWSGARNRADYPRGESGSEPLGRIYDYHTALRRAQSRARAR